MNGYFTTSDLARITVIATQHNLNVTAFIRHCEAKQRSGVNVTGGYDPNATIERQVNSFRKSPMA